MNFMWTQIDRSRIITAYAPPAFPPFPGEYPSNSVIYVDDTNGLSTVNIQIGNWLVIGAFSNDCEIRKVTDIITHDPGIYELQVSPALLKSHNVDDVVYVQSSPNWDILLFGANPQAIYPTSNADAINDANYCNQFTFDSFFDDLCGSIVSIPKGVYEVAYNSPTSGIIDLSGPKGNIKFIGEGMGVSVIKLATSEETLPDQPIFYVERSNNLEWHDLTIDGNVDNISSTTPVISIKIEGSDEFSGVLNDFILNRVEIINALSQGVDAKSVNRLHINNSKIERSKGMGVYIHGLSQNTWISGNYFNENLDHDLHFKAADSEYALGRNIITENNFYNTSDKYKNSIWVWGASYENVTDKIIISNNVIEGRALEILFSINVLVSNNILIGGYKVPFKASATVVNLTFENNIVTNKSSYTYAAILSNDTIYTINGALISGNTFEFGGIYSENAKNVSFVGNKIIQGSVSGNKGLECVISSSTFADSGNLLITNNQFTNIDDTGIQISTANSVWKFQLITIDTNLIDGTPIDGVNTLQYGIRIKTPTSSPSEYWTKALVGTSNVVGKATVKQIEVFGSYLVELNPYQESWISNGNPEQKLYAPQGSYAIDKTMAADNKYLKCSLETLNTGWMLVSELEKQLLFKDIFETPTNPLSSHTPNFNVFTPSTNWSTFTGTWSVVANQIARPTATAGSLAIATYSMQSNGELKAVFVYDPTISSPTSGDVGIIFREHSTNYWKFYITKSSGNFYLHAYKPSSTTDILNGEQVYLGNGSNLIYFVLKVEMNGDYISFFFNDRFLTSVKDNSNYNGTVHGLYASLPSISNMFGCTSFKLLIP